MIPKKYSAILFSLILSGTMSLLVSGIATLRAVGTTDGIVSLWASAWLAAWIFAFPAVMVVSPVARKAVALVVS
jgi:hypothetical protein